MKYYSEKTGKLYEDEDELEKAEKACDEARLVKEKAEKAKKEERKKRAEEVLEARKKADKAVAEARELTNKFVEDYGSFHCTIDKNSGEYVYVEQSERSNIENFINMLFGNM